MFIRGYISYRKDEFVVEPETGEDMWRFPILDSLMRRRLEGNNALFAFDAQQFPFTASTLSKLEQCGPGGLSFLMELESIDYLKATGDMAISRLEIIHEFALRINGLPFYSLTDSCEVEELQDTLLVINRGHDQIWISGCPKLVGRIIGSGGCHIRAFKDQINAFSLGFFIATPRLKKSQRP